MDVSPFSDPWMSRLDPSKAQAELGFEHEPLERYLEKIVASFFSHVPPTPPDNYVHRVKELQIAHSIGCRKG